MKNGFVGNAANNYFKKVYSTIEKGEKGINDGKDFSSNIGMKKNEKNDNDFSVYMETLDDYGHQLNESLASYSVAMNDDKYDYIAREIARIEDEVNGRLNYVISSMENLCTTDYILPETTPKIQKILEDIKNALPESRDIVKQHENEMVDFMYRINDIDK